MAKTKSMRSALLSAAAGAFADAVAAAFRAFHAVEFFLSGETEPAEHGQHHHADQEERYDLEIHALQTEPRPECALLDRRERVARERRAEAPEQR
ncbi:MAG: hypothetical protein KDK53_13895, partial [Maritimibacter sp.]|nr:hypothetical protein [Maritimibacter sp.]